jgi:two-component system, cell cycle sensor histidine kinase and response regulator CckA
VSIIIPRVSDDKSNIGSFEESTIQNLMGNETILVAEDKISVLSLATRVLRTHGYTVIEAKDGKEAIWLMQKSTEKNIELLLTDMVMPYIGGIALANQLRSTRPDMKILFMSGYAGDQETTTPGTAFLQKPFTPLELLRRVRQLLDTSGQKLT